MITRKKKREELQLLRDEALDAYMNREEFQYDLNADALYRHYKNQYTELGKTAMQDTMGQAAALTGGYGSSYAQSVGQQAYNRHMQQLGDVIPELYQLAYDRYQDKGDQLYRTYQSWAQLEQQAAEQEQRDREFELAEQRRRDENARFQLEQERKKSQIQTGTSQPDYGAMLADHQKLGQRTESKKTVVEPEYDNGNVSEGNIKTMQRLLGLQDTGKWTDLEQQKAGNLKADAAWQAYQQGKLQGRSRSGMSMEEWAAYKSKQPKSSDVSNTKENTPAVQNFISGMVTEDQAAERGVNSTEWKMMVVDRLKRMNMTMDEFEQLEKYYGLDIPGGSSAMPQGNTANNAAQKLSYAEYREKTAAPKVSDLNTAVQQYFNAYQAFANSAIYDIQYTGYNNAGYMRDIRVRTAKELRKRADMLASALRMNTDIISGDCSELLTQIVSTKTGIDSIMDFYGGQVKYYSRWDTEEEYKTGSTDAGYRQKYGNLSANELQAAAAALPDGEERDWLEDYAAGVPKTKEELQQDLIWLKGQYQYLTQMQNKSAELAALKNNLEAKFLDAPGYAELEKQYENMLKQYPSMSIFEDLDGQIAAVEEKLWKAEREEKYKFLNKNEDFAALSKTMDIVDLTFVTFAAFGHKDIDKMQYIKDDEWATLNYICEKEGRSAAKEYLNYLEYDLDKRKQAEIAEENQKFATEHPFWADIKSIGAKLASGIGLLDIAGQNAVKGIKEAITGEYAGPINYYSSAMTPNTVATSIRSTRAQNIANKYGVIDIDPEDHPFWLISSMARAWVMYISLV